MWPPTSSTPKRRLLALMCYDHCAELFLTFWTVLQSIQMGCLRWGWLSSHVFRYLQSCRHRWQCQQCHLVCLDSCSVLQSLQVYTLLLFCWVSICMVGLPITGSVTEAPFYSDISSAKAVGIELPLSWIGAVSCDLQDEVHVLRAVKLSLQMGRPCPSSSEGRKS